MILRDRASGTAWAHSGVMGPSVRQKQGMVYDSQRRAMVMFGGEGVNSSDAGETWELGAAGWRLRQTAQPWVGGTQSVAYDSGRGVTVYVDGALSFPVGNQKCVVRELGPDGWTVRPVGTGPAPSVREGHAVAYDAARGVTVLFGGCTTLTTCFDDTWEWDGAAWTQRSVPGPTARQWHMMAYDSVRHVVVLVGGEGSESGYDTWEWNGIAWTRRDVPGPGYSYKCPMAFDPGRGVTVLYGLTGTTWEWNGVVWSSHAAAGPGQRGGGAMAYDPVRQAVVLFGSGVGPMGYDNRAWAWDGTAWTVIPAVGPDGRANAGMVYDARLGGVRVLGGGQGAVAILDAWTLRTCGGACRADFDCSGALTGQDVWDFVGAWFAGEARADYDGIGGVTITDIFAFLGEWLAGC